MSFEVSTKEHSSATLVRLRREREIPGMFMEPMKGPFRIRVGMIPRDSSFVIYD